MGDGKGEVQGGSGFMWVCFVSGGMGEVKGGVQVTCEDVSVRPRRERSTD